MSDLGFSIGPDGERFPLPGPADAGAERDRLRALAAAQRAEGREVVVVVGLGFVGAVMAAVIADSVDAKGRSRKFVIGMQRPSPRSFWKIPLLNRGLAPVKSEDPEVDTIIARSVRDKSTLVATYSYDALELADVVVVDVQCDYLKRTLGDCRQGAADMEALEQSLADDRREDPARRAGPDRDHGGPGNDRADRLPDHEEDLRAPRARRRAAARAQLRARDARAQLRGLDPRLLARVQRRQRRGARARRAASCPRVLNTKDYPLTVLDRPIESETAKIIENSYRATILAFVDEWSLFAERNGVDLKKVIEAISVRPTHSNIMFPGPGIGGYCLPKDGGLGVWAYRHIHGFEDDIFRITPLAIDINDTRALHAAQLVRDALRNMGRPVAAAEVLLLGAAYREDVGDTRYSGSELIVAPADRDGRRDPRP